MSGIYIPGMEMPTDSHPTWIVLHSDGTVEYNEVSQSNPVGWNTLIQAAIPVPEHGRLIDAEEFKTHFWEKQAYFTERIYQKLDMMPTIIPASEEGKG